MRVEQQKAIAEANTNRRQWDRRPDESNKAWDAFLIYREMGNQRSLTKCSQLLGKLPLVVRRWRLRYDWDIRVASYDKMLDEYTEKAKIEEAKQMGVRHARMGMVMTEVATARIEEYAKSPELQASLTIGDVARLAKDGAQIEREARGEDRNTGTTANITFNFNMSQPPKWAPKAVVDGVVGNIARAIQEGKSLPEPPPIGIAGADGGNS